MFTTDSRYPTALASSSSAPTWVIDSGATDHVTVSMCSNFRSYAQRSHGRVRIADGTFTCVAGEGTIDVLPNVSLSSVLHVRQFSFNLVSVSSLTKKI